MTLGDRIGNWVDRQVDDIRDAGNFSYETLRGNDETIGRRAFGKSVLTLLAGGGAGGYAINEALEEDESQPDDSGQNSGNGGDSGDPDWDSGSADRDVESIYEVLDDAGDTDIERIEDWVGDAYVRGFDVNDVDMAYSDSENEYQLAFMEGGSRELPLWLTEDNGYSDSEVDTLREYDERGLLAEVFEPAAPE